MLYVTSSRIFGWNTIEENSHSRDSRHSLPGPCRAGGSPYRSSACAAARAGPCTGDYDNYHYRHRHFYSLCDHDDSHLNENHYPDGDLDNIPHDRDGYVISHFNVILHDNVDNLYGYDHESRDDDRILFH